MTEFLIELVITLIICIPFMILILSIIFVLMILYEKFDLWRFKYLFKYKEITRCKKCGRLEHDPGFSCDECKASFYLYYEIAKLPNGLSHGTLYDNWDNKETVMAKWNPFSGWKIKEEKCSITK